MESEIMVDMDGVLSLLHDVIHANDTSAWIYDEMIKGRDDPSFLIDKISLENVREVVNTLLLFYNNAGDDSDFIEEMSALHRAFEMNLVINYHSIPHVYQMLLRTTLRSISDSDTSTWVEDTVQQEVFSHFPWLFTYCYMELLASCKRH